MNSLRSITRAQDFEFLAATGRRVRGDDLWLTFLPTPGENVVALGFTIGKAAGPAVTRNRMRRRLRAAMRQLIAASEMPAGMVLIGARSPVATMPFPQLIEQLRLLIDRAQSAGSR